MASSIYKIRPAPGNLFFWLLINKDKWKMSDELDDEIEEIVEDSWGEISSSLVISLAVALITI